MRRRRDRLFAVLLAAIPRATIYVVDAIPHDDQIVFGRHDPDGRIWINERLAQGFGLDLATVGLHELVHFVYPRWSEARVTVRWLRLLASLTITDQQQATEALRARIRQCDRRRRPRVAPPVASCAA
jgi:hypothetical protein